MPTGPLASDCTGPSSDCTGLSGDCTGRKRAAPVRRVCARHEKTKRSASTWAREQPNAGPRLQGRSNSRTHIRGVEARSRYLLIEIDRDVLDSHGRVLGFVYASDQDANKKTFVSLELVRGGLAFPYVFESAGDHRNTMLSTTQRATSFRGTATSPCLSSGGSGPRTGARDMCGKLTEEEEREAEALVDEAIACFEDLVPKRTARIARAVLLEELRLTERGQRVVRYVSRLRARC
ncbi:MAG: hypothetical protein HOW73_14700 [Polyangiaceae bacterium]|nr:hypothetical protein [Polyangiaceae bacterium]